MEAMFDAFWTILGSAYDFFFTVGAIFRLPVTVLINYTGYTMTFFNPFSQVVVNKVIKFPLNSEFVRLLEFLGNSLNVIPSTDLPFFAWILLVFGELFIVIFMVKLVLNWVT